MHAYLNAIGKLSRAVPHFRGKDFLARKFIRPLIRNSNFECVVPLKNAEKIRLICQPEDWIPWNIFLYGHYIAETQYEKFMLGQARGSAVIFDVGANIGYYAVQFAQVSGGSVYAFEPGSYQFNMLKRNLDLNKSSGVIPEKKIVSDSLGNKRIYFSGISNTGASSLVKETGSFEDVTSVTLDVYCREHDINSIDLIKIDVEGYEMSVLRGLKEMIGQQRVKHLFIEIHDENLKKAGTSAVELCDFLKNNKYDAYSIRSGSPEPYEGEDESLVWFTPHSSS